MADVSTCPGCGDDVARRERQSCEHCGQVIPEPTVDVPTWEGRALLRWYVNLYMRTLAGRGDLGRSVRLQLRHPWLIPTLWFATAILHVLFGLFGPRTIIPWLTWIFAVAWPVVGAVSIVQQRALKIAVDELRRHGQLRES